MRSVKAVLFFATIMILGGGCATNAPLESTQVEPTPAPLPAVQAPAADSEMTVEAAPMPGAVEETAMEKEVTPTKEESAVMEKPAAMVLPKGAYTAYDPAQLSNANKGDVVLFFHAPWCPYCRAAEEDINANLGNIPDGLFILKTDYDSQTELKKKYGVTYQHTFVQVDAQGNMLKKWTGSFTLSDIVKQVQ